jgi:hypothetical protein
MTRTILIWVALGASLVTAVELLRYHSGVGDGLANNQERANKTLEPLITRMPPVARDRHVSASNAGMEETPGSMTQVVRPQPSLELPTREQVRGITSKTADSPRFTTDAVDPESVIGRPFPVSKSVDEGCTESYCSEWRGLLGKFAQEPRDPRWAAQTEADLRALALAEPEKYTVRSVECRSSLCVIEVASLFGGFSGIPTTSALYGKLFNGGAEFGFERDPSSARITVTVQTFERR